MARQQHPTVESFTVKRRSVAEREFKRLMDACHKVAGTFIAIPP